MTGWQIAALIYTFVMAAVLVFFVMLYRRRERDRQDRVAKHGWWRWRWSQDGWVRQCKICKAIQYGGDAYDDGPNEYGRIEP